MGGKNKGQKGEKGGKREESDTAVIKVIEFTSGTFKHRDAVMFSHLQFMSG